MALFSTGAFAQKLPFNQSIDLTSAYFINTPYKLGPLGEGPEGLFDQDPLYSFDVFDCTTFVETVMALHYSKNMDEFKKNISLK